MDRPADPPDALPPSPPSVTLVTPPAGVPPADPPPVTPVTPAAPRGPVAASPPPVSPPPASTLPAPVREPSPTLAAGAATGGEPTIAPESRMLPPHQSKVERVADHVAAISADLREWTELRIALVKRQVEGIVGIMERVQHLAEAAKLAVPGIVLILMGLLFLLLTLAFGIGALIDSVWGGFAIVTVLLLVVGGVLAWLGKKRYDAAAEAVAEAKRMERSQRHISHDDIETAQRRKAQLSAS